MKKFVSSSARALHIKKRTCFNTDNTDKTLYLCYTCGKSLSSSDSLDSHMKLHRGEAKHTCPICGKYYLFIFIFMIKSIFMTFNLILSNIFFIILKIEVFLAGIICNRIQELILAKGLINVHFVIKLLLNIVLYKPISQYTMENHILVTHVAKIFLDLLI